MEGVLFLGVFAVDACFAACTAFERYCARLHCARMIQSAGDVVFFAGN